MKGFIKREQLRCCTKTQLGTLTLKTVSSITTIIQIKWIYNWVSNDLSTRWLSIMIHTSFMHSYLFPEEYGINEKVFFREHHCWWLSQQVENQHTVIDQNKQRIAQHTHTGASRFVECCSLSHTLNAEKKWVMLNKNDLSSVFALLLVYAGTESEAAM